MLTFAFDNSYARLPEHFYAQAQPETVPSPSLIALNRPLMAELGIQCDDPDDPGLADYFAGNRLPEGAEPLAQAYAGHQFGNFVPQLGDGRAVLLGEVVTPDGQRRDIQLKGSGRTHFSRGGDGRAPIGPVLREYLVSEAMHTLGVPTTRALAAVTTGEPVLREQPAPGAVLTRVASSHLRIGTLQYFAARGDHEGLAQLVDYALRRHYPEALDADDDESPGMRLLGRVCAQQARTIAHWMRLGFIHGVMNTDNTSLSGETIDYGPCAFMEHYNPRTCFSSIDQRGRYAYNNQADLAQWNLARLAEALITLEDDAEAAVDQAKQHLHRFREHYEQYWLSDMAAKIGIESPEASDQTLIESLLTLMEDDRADFTLAFRALADAQTETPETLRTRFKQQDALDQWLSDWRQRLQPEKRPAAERRQAMQQVNPLLIPRNHQVEAVITAAEAGDLAPFHRLREALSRPFDEQPDTDDLQQPARPNEQVLQTFCGT